MPPHTRLSPTPDRVTPSVPPHHRFHVQVQQGALTLDIQAVLAAPWTVLFGPSGSGKSTVLRALAGLLPSRTHRFERRDPTQPDLWQSLGSLPPERRDLAYHPQGAVLLPHLSAERNLRLAETLHHLPASQSHLPALTGLLQLGPLLARQPAQLSGGERQRISLARALAVPGARLLLLDEPFAGLDRRLRDQLLPPLRAYLTDRGLPVLSVTHDPDEALLLEAEVLRIAEGKLLTQASAPIALQDELDRLRNLLDGPAPSP